MSNVIVTDGEHYNVGSYTDTLAAFNTDGLVDGVDYTESIVVNTGPCNVLMSWDWPTEPLIAIHSFLAVDYGNYDNSSPAKPILSSRLSDLQTLTATGNFGLQGNTTGFDVIYDLFLTATAGGNNAHSDEVEVFLHTPTYSQDWISSLRNLGTITTSGTTWEVSEGANGAGIPDYVFSPSQNQDLTSNTVNLKTLLGYLVSDGSVSGSSYFNGLALGAETETGSGSLQLNNFSVAYATTATAPTVTIGLANLTGSLVGNVNFTTQAAVGGQADAGSIVTITSGSTQLGEVTANASGNWTYSPTLANGYHLLTATETNNYGNTKSVSLIINLNTKPINLSESITYVLGQGKNGVYTIDPSLTGWTTANTVVTLQDGAASLGSVTSNSSGQWTYQTNNLSIGSHNIVASVDDVYGRTASASRSFIYNPDPAPTVTIGLADSTGSIVGNVDYTTNATIDGQADANATMAISDGNNQIATVTANAQGAWTYDPALANGYHSLTASETNAYGFAGSASIGINLNTTPINLSVSITYVLGQGKNGVYTIDPSLTGWTTANTVVTLQDGATSLGSVTSNSSGQWAYQTSNVSAGSHNIVASVDDVYGRTASASQSFIYNPNPAPTVTIGLADITGLIVGNVDYTTNPTIDGQADVNATVAISDGNSQIATVTANAQGAWTYDPALANGYHSLTASETNAYGFAGSASIGINLSTNPINLSESITYVLGQGKNGVYTIDPSLTGWTTANTVVTLQDGATSLGSVTSNSSGQWAYQTNNLSIGSHNIAASVDDVYGRTASASQSFIYNPNPAPTVTIGLADITGSIVGNIDYTTNPTIDGQADANATVAINDGNNQIATVTANAQGAWTYDPALANGYHSLTASETNAYGFSGSASIGINLNTTPINLSESINYVSGQGKNGVYSIDPALSGWTAPNSAVNLDDGLALLGSIASNSSGYWSYQTSNLSIGNHDLIASVNDVYGRTASASQSFSYT